MESKTAGTTVLIEIDVKKATPHGSDALANPASGVKITIIAPDGTTLVSAQAMTNNGTGLYSYLYQTAANAQVGVYEVVFDADDTTYDGRKRERMAFEITR